MTLSGLVDLFCTEPTVTAPSVTRALRRQPALDLTSPPPMRPLIAAALAATEQRRRRPPGAAGHLHLPRGRGADRRAASRLLGEDEVAYYPAWETLPHERLSPRSDTVGRRLAVLRRLAGNDELPPPRIIVAPVRSVLQPQVKGLGDLSPVRLRGRGGLRPRRPGRGAGRCRVRPGRPGRAARASSPSAAASSTSSRRPRSTRSGSTSSATPSRRSATSRWPTSDPATDADRGHRLALPRAAADRRGPRPGRRPGRAAPRADRDARQDRPGSCRRRDGGAVARPWSTAWSCWSTCCRPAPTCWSAIPSWSAAGRSSWSRPARSSCTRPGPRRPAAARRRSTWARRRTGRWPRSGPPRSPGVWPGGRCRRSAPARRQRAARTLIRTDDGEIVDFSARVSGAGVESRTVAGHAWPSLSRRHRGGDAATSRAGSRDGWRVVLVAEGQRH